MGSLALARLFCARDTLTGVISFHFQSAELMLEARFPDVIIIPYSVSLQVQAVRSAGRAPGRWR